MAKIKTEYGVVSPPLRNVMAFISLEMKSVSPDVVAKIFEVSLPAIRNHTAMFEEYKFFDSPKRGKYVPTEKLREHENYIKYVFWIKLPEDLRERALKIIEEEFNEKLKVQHPYISFNTMKLPK